ncbi:SPFH domain-containing protein [Blastopirellula sp. J2-11]|uniref:flotillin family protein n=1 Tax=Blastopirellula sp. J2-11 TaxID=2943192 RepID=UPI0021C6F204|nr:flotillin family protein [Blastopirellula sp. J2-11]UUO05297.1 SPFH domain-containing protein [Blastopirellula sp. J2-11]
MLHTSPLFSAIFGVSDGLFWVLVGVALFVMFVFSTMIFIAKQYKRCPSNRVLVIYGRTGKGSAARTVHGGASLVIPLLQDYAYLSLEPVQIDIPLRGALSSENIRVNVPSCFTVAIGTSPGVMDNAAVRLLGLTVGEIRKHSEELIFGQLRQVIASMRIEEINRDRDKLLEHIQSSLEPELNKIGLILINVNITDITDESGYIDAIGQKAASLAIQNARGDVAENLKMGEIRVAEADRAKLVSVALAQKEQIIGTREAERDQSIRVAEMQKEQTIGERTAEFEREAQVKNAERDKRVRIADADATAIEGENLSNAKIAASQAALAVKRAEAYQTGETRKKEAEAAVLEAQNRAMAKAALAEAERVEAEKRALLEAPAKAEKAKMEVDAAAEASKRRILAQADADAIYAKLEAEARGEYEKLAKKGEGLKQIVQACGSSKEAFQLMLLEHLDSLAESSAKAISNIKFDKVVVWEGGGAKDGRSSTADWLSGMAKTLPPMMQVLKDIGGVELPEAFIRYAEDGPEGLAKSVESNGAVATEEKPETEEEDA